MTRHLPLALLAAVSAHFAVGQALVLDHYSTAIADALNSLPFQDSGDSNAINCSDLAGVVADKATRIVAIECQNDKAFLKFLTGYYSNRSFLQTAEKFLANNQIGSPAGTSGSTSLVTKASVPEVLGIAEDAGALTQSSSGATTTFTGNARGLYRYLTGKEVFPYCPAKRMCGSGVARRLSGSISLDTPSSGTGTAATAGTTSSPSSSTGSTPLSGSNWRMSSWGVQFQVPLGSSDPNDSRGTFQKQWDNMFAPAKPGQTVPTADLATAADKLNTALGAALNNLETSTKYIDWKKQARGAVVKRLQATPAPSQEDMEKLLRDQLDALAKIVVDNNYITAAQIQTALTAANAFFAAREALIQQAQSKLPGISLAYANNHPLNQANVSNFKLVMQAQPKPGVISLTANVAADIYDSLPSGTMVGRWRDLQISAESDFTLPSQYDHGVLSLAGYFQYMATKAVLQIPAGTTAPGTDINLPGSAATLLAPAGNIWIVQAMVTFPLKNSTTKVPFGVSYSNRTELLTGHVLRAHVGLNFNFDQLFMK